MSTTIVPVLLDGRQFGCCADPPGVGDEVRWRLEWREVYRDVLGPRLELPVPLRRMDPPPGSVRLLLVEDGATVPAVGELGDLTVFWPAPVPVPRTVPIEGVLHEDHHVDIPDAVATTPGVIRRVRLVSWLHTLSDGAWRPVSGTEIPTDVQRSPKHIYSANPRDGDTVYRDATEVLADLEVVTG